MNRRELFSSLLRSSAQRQSIDGPPLVTDASLEPYTSPLTLEEVYHLLRRLGYGATVQQAAGYVGKTAEVVVEELLGTNSETEPTKPGAWVDAVTENPAGADLQTRGAIWSAWRSNMAAFNNWWLKAMAADSKGVERIASFWNAHFISEFSFDSETMIPPQSLYRQYLTLRKDRLADFRQLVLDISIDNSMVFYLGGNLNKVGKPNENFARELMELFTTGIGWYTEGDVKEAARVMTGWKSAFFNDEPANNGYYSSYFVPTDHDAGQKTVLGSSIAARTADNNTEYQVKMEEVLKLIEIIHEARPEAVSRFISAKLYEFFVYASPVDVNSAFVEDLAKVFRDSNFTVRPVLKAMFTSTHFFDPAMRGAQIKTPIECVAGLMRQLGVVVNDGATWTAKMDQTIYDAPDVSGWPGHHYWISTNTYPVRRQFARTVINAMTDAQVTAFIKQFPDHKDVHKFTKNVCAYLLPLPLSDERYKNYEAALLSGAPDYDWPLIVNDQATAAARVRNFLVAISKAPDFQLC